MPDTTFPNFDITKAAADLNKAAGDFNKALKEAGYVAVGLGVLGFQRAQVQRVELTKQLDEQVDRWAQNLPAGARHLLESVRAAAARPEQLLRSAVGLD